MTEQLLYKILQTSSVASGRNSERPYIISHSDEYRHCQQEMILFVRDISEVSDPLALFMPVLTDLIASVYVQKRYETLLMKEK